MINDLIEEFRDRIDLENYFSHFSFEIAKNEILSSKSNIIFLVGEPGSGKSFLLNYLYYKYKCKYILVKEPFLDKKEFLNNYDFENKKILIDEAQLLNFKMIEFLRILSDKGQQVIFAMHKNESKKVIDLPQFKSRYTQIIELKSLNFKEFEKYIYDKFIKHKGMFFLNNKSIKKVYGISKGNFRISKKLMFTMLTLLNYSLKNNLSYNSLDNCIFEMAAIELGYMK